MVLALSQGVVLDRSVVREDILPRPAAIAERLPFVEVLALTADIDHGIDRTRPAQDLSARPVIDAVREPRNGFGAVHPVEAAIIEGLAVADRDLHPNSPIRRPRFQQEHAMTSVLRETARHDPSRRSRPYNDEIVIHLMIGLSPQPLSCNADHSSLSAATLLISNPSRPSQMN